MKYTEQVIQKDLMHYMDYNERQAKQLVEQYRRNGELADLTDAIEEKKNACSRL